MTRLEPGLETLSQRELRNESGRVLRAVQGGQSFVLTNNRVPVARIIPIDDPNPTLTIKHPARRVGGWAKLGIKRKSSVHSVSELIDDLRQERQ